MAPIDYCIALAESRIAPPVNLDLGTIQQQELANTFRFHISQYLMRRASDWKTAGFTETLTDWPAQFYGHARLHFLPQVYRWPTMPWAPLPLFYLNSLLVKSQN